MIIIIIIIKMIIIIIVVVVRVHKRSDMDSSKERHVRERGKERREEKGERLKKPSRASLHLL